MDFLKSTDVVIAPRVHRITFDDLDLLCERLMKVQDLLNSELQSAWSQQYWHQVECQLQRKLAQMRSLFELQGN